MCRKTTCIEVGDLVVPEIFGVAFDAEGTYGAFAIDLASWRDRRHEIRYSDTNCGRVVFDTGLPAHLRC